MSVIDVFTDCKKREQALIEARRVLQHRGIAFISVPNERSFFWRTYSLRRNSRIRKIFGKDPLPQHIGQYAFSKKEVACLVKGYSRILR